MPIRYIQESGVDDPEFAINTEADMRENYDDLVAQHPAFLGSFEDYLASHTAIDIPADIVDTDAEQAFVAAYLED